MSEATVTRVSAAGSGRPQPLDLLYGETENELRAAVRSVLEDKAAWRDVLARTETAETYDTALWHTLAADIGLRRPADPGGARRCRRQLPGGRGCRGGDRPCDRAGPVPRQRRGRDDRAAVGR